MSASSHPVNLLLTNITLLLQQSAATECFTAYTRTVAFVDLASKPATLCTIMYKLVSNLASQLTKVSLFPQLHFSHLFCQMKVAHNARIMFHKISMHKYGSRVISRAS